MQNNKLRNYELDYYNVAYDNEQPENCPVLEYEGTIEQTAGYKCPVCEEYTHPIEMINNRCKHCGYVLNIK